MWSFLNYSKSNRSTHSDGAQWSLVKRKTDIIPISSVGKSCRKDLAVKCFGFLYSLKPLADIEKIKMADPIWRMKFRFNFIQFNLWNLDTIHLFLLKCVIESYFENDASSGSILGSKKNITFDIIKILVKDVGVKMNLK